MPVHLLREIAAAYLRTATYRPLDDEVFAVFFEQWEGEHGQVLWLAPVRGLDEGHTAEFEPLLDAMETPTRIVWDERDAWLDPAVSERIERLLAQAERVLLSGAGHLSMEDRPAELARALVEWLSEGATR